MSAAEEKYRAELLAVMWRWANESDLTMEQWLRATNDAVETVFFRAEPPKEEETRP